MNKLVLKHTCIIPSMGLVLFILLIGCEKKDWTYAELRDNMHGTYEGQYIDSTGGGLEIYQFIQIDDSISMIIGRSFDSTKVLVYKVDYEEGHIDMIGNEQVTLDYYAKQEKIYIIKPVGLPWITYTGKLVK